MRVEWIEEDRLAQGHGVEFFHDGVSSDAGAEPVAFLEGYDWLHEGSRAVVHLLTLTSLLTVASGTDLQRIAFETQIAVLTFLLDGVEMVHGDPSPRITDRVWAHVNA